jgi:hypothetical protein
MDFAAATTASPSNPFIILTFIVAPAILTNASALLVLSTSNRFARAIDRAREISRQLEDAEKRENAALIDRLENELLVTERRAVLLLKSLRSFYFSLGGFALAVVVSLVGAGMVSLQNIFAAVFTPVVVITLFLAVGGLVAGAVHLIQETRITVGILQDRIKRIREAHQTHVLQYYGENQ